MKGAGRRIRRERGLAWEQAMLPYQKKPPSLREFTGEPKRVEPAAFLDMRLRASVRGIKTVTMAQRGKT